MSTSTCPKPPQLRSLRQPPAVGDPIQRITLRLIDAASQRKFSDIRAADPSLIDPFTLFEAASIKMQSASAFETGFSPQSVTGPFVVLFFKFPAIFANHAELAEFARILEKGSVPHSRRPRSEVQIIEEHLHVCEGEMEISMGTLSIIGWNATPNVALRRLGLTTYLLELYRFFTAAQ